MAVRARVLAFSQRGTDIRDGFGFMRPITREEIFTKEATPSSGSIAAPQMTVVIEGLENIQDIARRFEKGSIDHAVWRDGVIVRIVGTASIRPALSAAAPDALDALDRAVRAWNDPPRDVALAGKRRIPLSKRAHIMGILNVTPDSFSDGGRYVDVDAAVKHGLQLVDEGADIVDVGGESTRPGASPVDAAEEIRRVVPVIEQLSRVSEVPISVDTMKAPVARAALDAGAHIVNDVSAGRFDSEMLPLVAERGCAIVLMHMLGEPRTMQADPRYLDVIGDIYDFLAERTEAARAAGIAAHKIVIDPGIGFGKARDHNLVILRRLREFTCLGYPVLVGTSRKSFIGATLEAEVGDRLEGTAATVAYSVLNGAAVVRVHEVGYMRRVTSMVEAVTRATEFGGGR